MSNTYGDISPKVSATAARKLLKRAHALMVIERFGQVKPLGKNKTGTIKFRRYEKLPPALTPLTEGVPPAGQALTYTDYNATLQQYGDFIEITDVINDLHDDPVLDECMTLCSEQAAETIELIRIAGMTGGANVMYAGGVGSRTLVNSTFAYSDFQKIERFFNRVNAKKITSIVKASSKYDTTPIAPSFIAFTHTDLKADFEALGDNFTPVHKYSNSDRGMEGEIGKVGAFRIISTSLFNAFKNAGVAGTTYLADGETPTSAEACDVYPIICIAKDAYGLVPFKGKKAVKVMVKNPDTDPTTVDPLAQKGFTSWKCYQAFVILNDQFLLRLETACTA